MENEALLKELKVQAIKSLIGCFKATKMTVDRYGEEHYESDYLTRFRSIKYAVDRRIILNSELRAEWLKVLEGGEVL